MFSSDELLHLVFANETDTYYCSELLALDLHQYLWLKLHELGYGCVYFLELHEGEITVRTFGDSQAEPYVSEKAKLWSFSRQKQKNGALRKWLQRQLTAKDPRRAAVICPIKDFCDYFESEAWQDYLSELASMEKRTGVLLLTASPEAESSQRYLLSSPVFDYLGETGITGLRSAPACDMYVAVKRDLGERMVFLNAFTQEQIHSMLTRLLLADPHRTADYPLRKEMEEYLLQWMNNPALRRAEQRSEERMLPPDSRLRYAFNWLQKEPNWNWIATKARQIAAAGGIESYLRSLDCPLADNPTQALCLRRSADSYAWRCLHLQLSSAGAESDEREQIVRLIDQIRELAGTVQNREENPLLIEAVDRFLPELQAVDLSGDPGTVRRILFSIRFCLQWICVRSGSPEEADILSVVEKLRNYVTCSSHYHICRRNYELAKAQHSASISKLTAMALRQQQQETETARRMLATFEDVVQASVVNLSPAASSADISELARNLSQELGRQEAILEQDDYQDSPEPEAEPGEEPVEEPEDPEIFVLNDSDFDIMPHH